MVEAVTSIHFVGIGKKNLFGIVTITIFCIKRNVRTQQQFVCRIVKQSRQRNRSLYVVLITTAFFWRKEEKAKHLTVCLAQRTYQHQFAERAHRSVMVNVRHYLIRFFFIDKRQYKKVFLSDFIDVERMKVQFVESLQQFIIINSLIIAIPFFAHHPLHKLFPRHSMIIGNRCYRCVFNFRPTLLSYEIGRDKTEGSEHKGKT